MKPRKLIRKKKSLQSSGKMILPPILEDEVRQGMHFLQINDLLQGELCFRRVLSHHPNHAHSLHMLGIIALKSGHFMEAEELMEKSLRHDKHQPGCYNNLGMIKIELGKTEAAADCFARALRIQPDFFEALLNRGNNLRKVGKAEEALPSLKRAVEMHPEMPMVHHSLGSALRNLGRYDEAIDSFRRAIELNPEYGEAHYRLGTAFQGKELHDDAARSYERALELDQSLEKAISKLALCRKFTETDRGLIAMGEKALQRENLQEVPRIEIHFGLGKAYDDLNDFDHAFAHYEKGNRLVNEKREFDRKNAQGFTDGMISRYSKEYFTGHTFPGSLSELPVFIVGMPRSGTTLTEQIISRHSLVCGAGELNALFDVTKELLGDKPNPGTAELLVKSDNKTLSEMAETYIRTIKKLATCSELRVTDKLPHNFQFLGLISTLFPNAKIIHCRRNPLDTCLSIYFQYFQGAHEYAYDLENLGFAYREYMRLMEHWRKVLPVSMLEVDYEETISDIEGTGKKLISFIGLDWEKECVNYHKSIRMTKTASAWQVRQPIYTTSRNRWRNYEKFIEPLREALGDLCE